jgi:hypothetical protein
VRITVPGLTLAKHALIQHTSAMIQDGAITQADLADGAVTNAKLASGAVSSGKVTTPGFETLVDDLTTRTTTSTSYALMASYSGYDGWVVSLAIRSKFRTTGSATAYVKTRRRKWTGYTWGYEEVESSTTSTSTVQADHGYDLAMGYNYPQRGEYLCEQYAMTSNASVAAEVSEFYVRGRVGVLVR